MIAKLLIVPLVLIILALVWFGRGTFFRQFLTPTAIPTAVQTLTPDATVVPIVAETPVPTVAPVPTKVVPSGWQTYTNSQYGFTISYPSDYKVLTDKENLYGWPDAIALLYAGGQAYDIAIEVWDSENEYKTKYPTENLKVYPTGGKFITVADQTKNAETQEIVESFSLSK